MIMIQLYKSRMSQDKFVSDDIKAAKLLDLLEKDQNDEIQIITPTLQTFLACAKKFSSNAIANIKDYQTVIKERNDHIEKISKLKIKGCRGQLASNLISFAMSGNWSVVSQNYVHEKIQYKVPIICIRSVLDMMYRTRKEVQKKIKQGCNKNDVTEIVEAFQVFSVVAQEEYMDKNPNKHDYMKAWSKASSWSELTKNPLKNHDKWMFFFTTTEKPNIEKLMDDIFLVLRYYDDYMSIRKLYDKTKTSSSNIILNSTAMSDSCRYIVKDQQLKLLHTTNERNGNETNIFSKASELNSNNLKRKFENINNSTENQEDDFEDNETFDDMMEMYSNLKKIKS